MNDKAPLPQTESNTGDPTAKRPYVAPELVVFGNVEDFTRGAGVVSPFDKNKSTRKKN